MINGMLFQKNPMRQTELVRSYSEILRKISAFVLPLSLPSSTKSCKIDSRTFNIHLIKSSFIIQPFCPTNIWQFVRLASFVRFFLWKFKIKSKFFFFLIFFLIINLWRQPRQPKERYFFFNRPHGRRQKCKGRAGAPLHACSGVANPCNSDGCSVSF